MGNTDHSSDFGVRDEDLQSTLGAKNNEVQRAAMTPADQDDAVVKEQLVLKKTLKERLDAEVKDLD